ncbi:hypothetical protein AK812_SmicGene21647 [Symbiodinium microadriaticum]|uniref:Uncharacterized protein n=1 Tax=Symbiodinium microadriaticum TaxID=2951 RepID=A0A1Q9DLV6_SYMMI|nr:hypothetical protein AK812_SmicGene21647 [Symbiodinium microadriaticum]
MHLLVYKIVTTAVFSTVFRRTSTVREVRDLRRVRTASWWLCENEDVVRADLVYYPQTLSLDHHLAIAYESWTSSRETIGPVSHTVVFDSWPATKMVLDRWRCCRCVRRRINQGNYAKMTCTVEIVATEVAAEHPVISGVFAPPQDRLSLQMLATNPVKTLRVLLGPQLFNLITVGTFLGCSLVVTFLIILTVFYAHALLTA